MADRIGILMATYNGAAFLHEQLASIAAQTHRDWHLYVRDDGSSDATPDLVATFAKTHPEQVTWIEDDLGSLGARGNFARLMEVVETPYIAFADQDDIWHPEKLALTYAVLRQLEINAGGDTPCMVHADRRIVDAEGHLQAASFWASRGLSPASFPTPEAYYAFCLAAGSTMLINQALRTRSLPVPDAARMHDCWIELVAHAVGQVGWIDTAVLDYRHHGANASGSGQMQSRRIWARAARLWRQRGLQRDVYRIYFDQAAAFHTQIGATLPTAARQRLEEFLSIPGRSLPGRFRAIRQSQSSPPGLVRRLVFAWLSGGVSRR